MADDGSLAAMRHPRTVMTFSDSGAHVSQIIDCSIQTHLLAYWVREREAFTLEEAVRMITLAPATAWGLADRGLVREGFVADLNVFDPDAVAPDDAHGRSTTCPAAHAGSCRRPPASGRPSSAARCCSTTVSTPALGPGASCAARPEVDSRTQRAYAVVGSSATCDPSERRNPSSNCSSALNPRRVPVDGCQRSVSVPSWNAVIIAGWT